MGEREMAESPLVSLVQMLIQRIQESHDPDIESLLKEKLILFLQHASQVCLQFLLIA